MPAAYAATLGLASHVRVTPALLQAWMQATPRPLLSEMAPKASGPYHCHTSAVKTSRSRAWVRACVSSLELTVGRRRYSGWGTYCKRMRLLQAIIGATGVFCSVAMVSRGPGGMAA
eukprot:356972-Chlamydomonas_euryale.AAC.3